MKASDLETGDVLQDNTKAGDAYVTVVEIDNEAGEIRTEGNEGSAGVYDVHTLQSAFDSGILSLVEKASDARKEIEEAADMEPDA